MANTVCIHLTAYGWRSIQNNIVFKKITENTFNDSLLIIVTFINIIY